MNQHQIQGNYREKAPFEKAELQINRNDPRSPTRDQIWANPKYHHDPSPSKSQPCKGGAEGAQPRRGCARSTPAPLLARLGPTSLWRFAIQCWMTVQGWIREYSSPKLTMGTYIRRGRAPSLTQHNKRLSHSTCILFFLVCSRS
jgi:hypothetical protein